VHDYFNSTLVLLEAAALIFSLIACGRAPNVL
jgi:hypothetical protein